jgi:hypothetical protein
VLYMHVRSRKSVSFSDDESQILSDKNIGG